MSKNNNHEKSPFDCLLKEDFYSYFEATLKAIEDALNSLNLWPLVSSMYVVNFDISKETPEVVFDVPIYLKDNKSYTWWILGYKNRKSIGLGEEYSFVEAAFKECKNKVISFLFILNQNGIITIEFKDDKNLFVIKGGMDSQEVKKTEIKETKEFINFKDFSQNLWNEVRNVEINRELQQQINEQVKNLLNNQQSWKQFYQQETFEKLLKIGLCFLSRLKGGNEIKSFALLTQPVYFENTTEGLKELTSGGVVISLLTNEEDKINEIIKSIKETFFPWLAKKTIYDLQKRLRHHALRSAVAAIMIRNFAHHHGSHVLPRIEVSVPGVKEYLTYLQEKTSLLNILSVYEPICEGKVNLKDALQYLNNNNNNKGVNLFLKYFAEANNRAMVTVSEIVDSDFQNFDSAINVYVSPGYGEIGIHALYIIFENYVRNLLKHSKPRNDNDNPLVYFKVNKVNTFAEVTIDTLNYFLCDENGNLIEDQNKNKGEEIKNKITGIIRNIHKNLIDELGKPDFSTPGIKEMKICANILCGKEFTYSDELLIEPFVDNTVKEKNGYFTLGYKFKIPLSKYVVKADLNTLSEIRRGKEIKPDFLVINSKLAEEVINNHFDILPQRICWVGDENGFSLKNLNNWTEFVKRRSVFIDEKELESFESKSEEKKYKIVLEKWFNKMFNGRGIRVKFHGIAKDISHFTEEEHFEFGNKSSFQEFHFPHSEERQNCENSCPRNAIKLVFSHVSNYRIYRTLEQASRNDLFKEIFKYELSSILLFKILIIDNEIKKIIEERYNSQKQILNSLNICVESEKNVNNGINYNDYDCVVFHLGMLDSKKSLYDIQPEKLSPYVRIVTGRARPIDKEVRNKCLWARSRQIDRSVLLRAFERFCSDPFDTKYKLYQGVLS